MFAVGFRWLVSTYVCVLCCFYGIDNLMCNSCCSRCRSYVFAVHFPSCEFFAVVFLVCQRATWRKAVQCLTGWCLLVPFSLEASLVRKRVDNRTTVHSDHVHSLLFFRTIERVRYEQFHNLGFSQYYWGQGNEQNNFSILNYPLAVRGERVEQLKNLALCDTRTS